MINASRCAFKFFIDFWEEVLIQKPSTCFSDQQTAPVSDSNSSARKVAVIQSNYIPWKGYFDIINSVDEFILYDDVQYTRRDWRNRNLIKTRHGVKWLTIPVKVRGEYKQRVCDTKISDPGWGKHHWENIRHHYSKAPFFGEYKSRLSRLFLENEELSLSAINRRFIEEINDILGITTTLSWSMEYQVSGDQNERLIGLCQQVGATSYLSGKSASSYINEKAFSEAGITVSYVSYDGYLEYPQLYGAFEHRVSILDLILNVGPDAISYLNSIVDKSADCDE